MLIIYKVVNYNNMTKTIYCTEKESTGWDLIFLICVLIIDFMLLWFLVSYLFTNIQQSTDINPHHRSTDINPHHRSTDSNPLPRSTDSKYLALINTNNTMKDKSITMNDKLVIPMVVKHTYLDYGKTNYNIVDFPIKINLHDSQSEDSLISVPDSAEKTLENVKRIMNNQKYIFVSGFTDPLAPERIIPGIIKENIKSGKREQVNVNSLEYMIVSDLRHGNKYKIIYSEKMGNEVELKSELEEVFQKIEYEPKYDIFITSTH